MNKHLVICVDDEQIVLNSLKIQLRWMLGDQYEIETCTDPAEALLVLEESLADSIKVPIIISDYVMPMMKGDQFLKEARTLSPMSRMVMLTGQATIDGVTNAINNAQLFRYLEKPWDELDLRLTMSNAAESYFAEEEIVALGAKNEKLYNKMKKNFESTIRALSDAIDARDSYTIGHSKRVTAFAVEMGKIMGYTPEKLEQLEYMSVLHDIGKIGIPDYILKKEGGLSDGEYDIMKRHVSIGVGILKNIVDYEMLLPGVLYHHERFDGKGYESLAAGEDIPIDARIICIADAFDAMTSDRPYRKALPIDVAIAELQKNSGTQFDPALTAVFVAFMQKNAMVNA